MLSAYKEVCAELHNTIGRSQEFCLGTIDKIPAEITEIVEDLRE